MNNYSVVLAVIIILVNIIVISNNAYLCKAFQEK